MTSKKISHDDAELRRGIAEISLDEDFADLVTGKRVIVVGPAETLRGTAQGKNIDAHDLVVRFNTAIQYVPFPADLAKDIGARTDILYCNNEVLLDGILRQGAMSHQAFRAVCARAQIKYVVSTNNDFTSGNNTEKDALSEHLALKLLVAHLDGPIGFRMLYSTCAVARKLLDGYVGRTGFLAILDLLSYDIRQLSIVGMTFYHKGGHLFFENAGELDPMKSHLGQVPPGNVKGHNSYFELDVMKKLARVYGKKLKFDDHLEALLATRL